MLQVLILNASISAFFAVHPRHAFVECLVQSIPKSHYAAARSESPEENCLVAFPPAKVGGGKWRQWGKLEYVLYLHMISCQIDIITLIMQGISIVRTYHIAPFPYNPINNCC